MNPQFRLTSPAIRDIEQIADRIAKQSGLERSEIFEYPGNLLNPDRVALIFCFR